MAFSLYVPPWPRCIGDCLASAVLSKQTGRAPSLTKMAEPVSQPPAPRPRNEAPSDNDKLTPNEGVYFALTTSRSTSSHRHQCMARSRGRSMHLIQFGFLVGSAGTVYALRRTGRPMTPLRVGGLSFFGGFAGSMFFLPIGIAMSRGSLQSIEDPKHLTRVLQQKMEKSRRDGKPMEPVHNPTANNNNTTWDAPITETPLPSMAPSAPASQDWGASAPAPAGDAPPPPETGAGTRWDALRKDRTGTPSVWDQIRQQKAKEALGPAQSSAAASSPSPAAPPSDAGFTSTNNDADYERAEREYYEAFERERQGVDTLTGFQDENKYRS